MILAGILVAVVAVIVVLDIRRYARRRRHIERRQNKVRSLAYEYAWNRVMRRPLSNLLTDQRTRDGQ